MPIATAEIGLHHDMGDREQVDMGSPFSSKRPFGNLSSSADVLRETVGRLFPSGKVLLTEPEAILGFNLLVPGPNRVLPRSHAVGMRLPTYRCVRLVEHAAAARSDWYLLNQPKVGTYPLPLRRPRQP